MVRSSKQGLTLGNLRVDKDDLRRITLRMQLWGLFDPPIPSSCVQTVDNDRTLEPFLTLPPYLLVALTTHIQDFAYHKIRPKSLNLEPIPKYFMCRTWFITLYRPYTPAEAAFEARKKRL